jgi:SSS family solute:Na+ symporter
MQFVDMIIVSTYFVSLLLIGWYASKKQNNIEDYYVAGRKMGPWSSMALWLASWIGGASIIGSSNTAYHKGITSIWYIGSIAIGCLLFALIFSKVINRVGSKFKHLTYPDFIEERYDSKSRLMATVSTILAYIAYSAGQLLATASIIHVLLEINLGVAFIIATTITIVYTAYGGFLAVTYTDWIQFVLLIIGVVIIGVPIAIKSAGGLNVIATTLPKSYYNIGAWGWPHIIGLTISLIFSFFTSMDNYTRTFAAKDENAAKSGLLYAVIGVIILAISSVIIGMAGKIIFPSIPPDANIITVMVLNLFPAGIKGLVIVGILSAIMSTADTCILVTSANITKDIYHRYIDKKASETKLLKISFFSSAVVGVVSALFAWKMMSIVNILYIAFTINSASLFVPTIAAVFWKKATSKASFWSMLLSLITVLFWYGAKNMDLGVMFNLDPIWPGLIVSTVVFVGLSLTDKTSEDEKLKAMKFAKVI